MISKHGKEEKVGLVGVRGECIKAVWAVHGMLPRACNWSPKSSLEIGPVPLSGSLGEYLECDPELWTRIQNVLKPGRITHGRKLSSYSRSLGVSKSHTHREYFVWDDLNLRRQEHVYSHVHICECVELCLSFCITACLFLQRHSMNTMWPALEQWKEYSLGILSPLSVLISTSYERKVFLTPAKTPSSGGRKEFNFQQANHSRCLQIFLEYSIHINGSQLFLMLQPHNTNPHSLVTSDRKIILIVISWLKFCYCYES